MIRVVIKLGGEILAPERLSEARAIAADVKALFSEGNEVVIVHGGGPQTTALQKKLGQEPRMVAGRRITDQDALDAIKMIVAGKLNVELCALLLGAGAKPVGLSGASARAIAAEKRPPRVVKGGGDMPIDFGYVGDVIGVNNELLQLLLSSGYLPVLACVGADASGAVYNINADTVASGVARAIGADRLVAVTSTRGVLSDLKDPASRIPRLSKAEADRAIDEGSVAGGMIAKLDESFEALLHGVKGVHVVGGLGPGELRRELEWPGSIGTVLVP
jgi:acetylglutamate kinase